MTNRFAVATAAVFLVAVGGQFLGWIATKVFFFQVAYGGACAANVSTCPGLNFLGTATLYLLISTGIASLADLRLSSAYTYFAARGGDLKVLSGAYLTFRLASMSAVAVAFALLAPEFGFPLEAHGLPLYLFLAVPLLETPSFVYSWGHVARGDAARGQVPFLVEAVVRTSLLVVVALQYTQSTVNISMVTYMAAAYVVGASASALYCLGYLSTIRLRHFGHALRTMFTFSAPLMGAMFLTYTVGTITPFFVAYYLNNAQLQIFAVANAFFILLMFLPNAITVPLFPDMASLHIRGEDQEIRRRTRKGLRFTVMLLAPVVVAVVVFRVNLLNILYSNVVATGGFVSGATALIFLAVATVPQSIFRIMGTVLDAVGQQRREFYLSAVQLGVMVALLYLLVPSRPGFPLSWGVTGAGVAILGAALAGLGMNAIWLHRYVGVHLDLKPYAVILGGASLTFLLFSRDFSHLANLGLRALPQAGALRLFSRTVPELFLAYPPVQEVLVLLLVLAGGVVVYAAVLIATGELSRRDALTLAASVGLPRSLAEDIAQLCWREGDEDREPTASRAGDGEAPPSAR